MIAGACEKSITEIFSPLKTNRRKKMKQPKEHEPGIFFWAVAP